MAAAFFGASDLTVLRLTYRLGVHSAARGRLGDDAGWNKTCVLVTGWKTGHCLVSGPVLRAAPGALDATVPIPPAESGGAPRGSCAVDLARYGGSCPTVVCIKRGGIDRILFAPNGAFVMSDTSQRDGACALRDTCEPPAPDPPWTTSNTRVPMLSHSTARRRTQRNRKDCTRCSERPSLHCSRSPRWPSPLQQMRTCLCLPPGPRLAETSMRTGQGLSGLGATSRPFENSTRIAKKQPLTG